MNVFVAPLDAEDDDAEDVVDAEDDVELVPLGAEVVVPLVDEDDADDELVPLGVEVVVPAVAVATLPAETSCHC